MAESRLARLLTLLNAPMVAAYTAAGFWGDETIYHLAARHARTMPQAYAVRDRRRRLSYAELATAANRLATHLSGHVATAPPSLVGRIYRRRRLRSPSAVIPSSSG
jgi:non-ribosomal peptide synthetase component E (peptide arylation enzyme)